MAIKLKDIEAAIEDAQADLTIEKNDFTAMSRADLLLHLGYVPGPGEPTLQEAERAAQVQYEVMREAGTFRSAGAPSAFDLRNVAGKNYITEVKNQQSCGSCVAFGSVAAVEGTIRLKRNQPDLAINLSEAHLFYCHARSQGRNCGNGWWVPPALDSFRDIGVSDDTCYPYTPGDQNCTNLCGDWKARVVKITAWQEISSATAMKDWLSSKGPLVACFSVYDDFFAYKSGVYRHVNGALAGGHCVCCVGYDDVAGCWICKNSWGEGWGDKGYFRIAYGNSGIDDRMWGVEVPKPDVLPTWIEKKQITGLWVINEVRNGSAYVSGIGWRKVAADSDSAFLAMMSALASAKASQSPVNLRIENGVIKELYVF
jgi:C1A family cysteine protease